MKNTFAGILIILLTILSYLVFAIGENNLVLQWSAETLYLDWKTEHELFMEEKLK